ncbi:MAG: cation transporter [Candidatus Omnitrophica bacterium]|nr:cation transporter [Candidatus Omnitrophota bacterium]
MNTRSLRIRNILIAILALNWLVAAAKIIYGFMTKSTAMSADGFHSFADGASNIIGIVGIWIASQPTDKDHPYGHKKYETFATIVIAMLLFLISFNLIRGGIVRLFNPVIPDVTAISFVVMAFTIMINCFVFAYERGKARELGSDILKADSFHTRSDILVSVAVVFTLLAVKSGFPMIDAIVSIAIALFIGHGAIEILKESSDVLCDRAAGISDELKGIVAGIEGVKGCHKIRERGRPDDIYVDLHVLVEGSMDVAKAHQLANTIEEAIKEKITGITDITVHIEPDTIDEKDLES